MRRVVETPRLLAAGIVVALVALPTAAAAASGEALVTTWEGPTVDLAWGGPSAAPGFATFPGAPVVVPGDVQGRTITVTNAGPTDAVLRGWVRDVRLLHPDATEVGRAAGAPPGDFYTDLTLTWRTASGDGGSSFRQLATAGATPVVDVFLARGASTQVTVVTSLSATATSGNRANVAPREATYEVLLRLDGHAWATADAPPSQAAAGTDPVAVPQADSIVTIAEVLSAGESDPAPLAVTGVHVLRAALVAVVGIGTGSLLTGAARRRRGAGPGSPAGPSAG